MAAIERDKVVGWFNLKGRPGDRTIDQQMRGLESLDVKGKTLLDVGCAEGLVSIKLVRDGGARAAHGIEIVEGHVDVANKLRGDLPCTFEVQNANEWAPRRQYDVVLLLAILHKLRNPSLAAVRFAAAARELVVVRLPVGAPVITDWRSQGVPHDIDAMLCGAGFAQEQVTLGPFDEWTGFYRRKD